MNDADVLQCFDIIGWVIRTASGP